MGKRRGAWVRCLMKRQKCLKAVAMAGTALVGVVAVPANGTGRARQGSRREARAGADGAGDGSS